MDQNGSKWIRMDQNMCATANRTAEQEQGSVPRIQNNIWRENGWLVLHLLLLVENGTESIKMDQNGSKWIKMDQIRRNLFEMDKIDQNGSFLIKMDQTC